MSSNRDRSSSSDEEDEQQQQQRSVPQPPLGSTSTPSNTPVVSLFAKAPSSDASGSQKRTFEAGLDSSDLVNKMLGALNVGKSAPSKADDDEDDEDEDDEDDEEDEEEGEDVEFIAEAEDVEAALPGLRANHEQLEKLKLEYTKARRDLEIKFEALREPILKARAEQVRGEILPGFWLDAIKRNSLLSQFVEEWDEPCLMFLDDITCKEIKSEDDSEFGFELEFHFAEDNPYFTNHTLKKRCVVINHYPVDGSAYPDVESMEGTEIDWKPNQNLTVRIEVKKEVKRAGARRGQAKGPAREVRQEVPQESFFTFFETPRELTEEDAEEMDDEEQELVQRKWETDFAIASTLRSKLVPDALLWYLGEASESEYDDDDEEDEDYDDEEGQFQQLDDEEDSEDDSEDDEQPKGKSAGARKQQGARRQQQPSAGSNADEEKKPECNQQ